MNGFEQFRESPRFLKIAALFGDIDAGVSGHLVIASMNKVKMDCDFRERDALPDLVRAALLKRDGTVRGLGI